MTPRTISLGRVLKGLDSSLHSRLLERISTGRCGVVLTAEPNGAERALAYGPACGYASRETALLAAEREQLQVIGDMPPGGKLSTTKVAYALLLLSTRQIKHWRDAADLAEAHRTNMIDTMVEAGLLKG